MKWQTSLPHRKGPKKHLKRLTSRRTLSSQRSASKICMIISLIQLHKN
jgi:hypothetical protein